MLKNSGFTNIHVATETVSDFTKNGLVISQSPNNKSKEYPLDTEITITVGRYGG